jgi:hypothetical protein
VAGADTCGPCDVLIRVPPDVYHRTSMRDCAPVADGKMDEHEK